MGGAFREQSGDSGAVVGCGRGRRGSLSLAQLFADFPTQRQQALVVGHLLQALFDLQQAGFIGAIPLVIQRPGQEFLGFHAALFGLGLLAGQFGFFPLFGFGLLAGQLLLAP